MRRTSWRRYARAGLVLCLLFTGIEIVFVGKVDPQETPVGFGVALFTAACTAAVLAASGARYRMRWSWLLLAGRITRNVVRDTGTLGVVLARAIAGRTTDSRIEEIAFDPGGDDPQSAARRALATAAVSTAPNSIVLGIDRERGTMRVHYLSKRAASAPASTRWPL